MKKSEKTTRIVRISVCMPVTVEVVATKRDGDWEIAEIRSCSCEPSPSVRTVTECMRDEDFDEFYRSAEAGS